MKKIIVLIMICVLLTGCSLRVNTNMEYKLNGYGKYNIPSNYMLRKDHSTSSKYFFVNKKDRTSNRPNNISVEGGTNKYSKDEHLLFRQAIMAQLHQQVKMYNATVNGSGINSKNGYIVYKFIIEGNNQTTIQYYIVGDYKYILVHETIFDNNVNDVDKAAMYIVNSFIWE